MASRRNSTLTTKQSKIKENCLDLALTYLATPCPSWQDDMEPSSLSMFVSFVEGCAAAWLRSSPVLFRFVIGLYIHTTCVHSRDRDAPFRDRHRRGDARGGDAMRSTILHAFTNHERGTRTTTTTESTRERCRHPAERVVRSDFDIKHDAHTLSALRLRTDATEYDGARGTRNKWHCCRHLCDKYKN